MTRIFTEGFESRDTLFWDTAGGSIVAGQASPYACTCGGNYKAFTPVMEGYWRFRVYFPGFWGWANADRLPGFRHVGSIIGYLYIDSALHQIGAVLGACNLLSTQMINLNQSYLIEVHIKIDAVAGMVEVKLDGIPAITFNGNTGTTHIDGIWLGNINYHYFNVDDMAMNDTDNADGKNDNSWCGRGVVLKVPPIGDGAHSNWHGSDLDDIDNFEMCNEFPNDGDATYVYHDITGAGVQQQFTVDNSFSGVGRTVLRVWAEGRARKTDADDCHIKMGMLAAGGVDVMSANQDLLVGAYNRFVGPDAKINPVDSAAWEDTDIAALEIVTEIG